jgi:PAS domain S-box-containing protein
MDSNFEKQIERLQRRVQKLSQRVKASEAPKEMVQEAVEQLSNSLEELHVAEEELEVQNEELRTMRAELNAERQRYEALFNFAPGGYLVTDAQGVIQEANRAAAEMLGVPQQHLPGKPLIIHVPEAERKTFYAQLAAARAGESDSLSPFQMRLRSREGDAFHASITVAPGRGDGDAGDSLRWLIRDVTARKRAEEAVRKSQERYRALFENNHAPMLLIDPETGAIVDANPAACAYYGYDPDEFREQSIWQINQRSKEAVFAEIRRAKEEEHRHFHFRHRLASGEVREVEVYSGPIEVGGRQLLYSIIHDITARVEARRELKQRETRLQILNAIVTNLIEGLSTEEIVQHAIHQLQAALPEVRASYCTLDNDGELCVRHAAEHPEMPSRKDLRFNVNAAPAYYKQLQWEQNVASDDVRRDERLTPLADFHAAGGSRATLDVPIKQWNELTGLLCFDAPRPHPWSDFETDLLTDVAKQLSTAFRQAYIEQERRKVEKELVESEMLLREAQERGKMGNWVYDVKTGEITWSEMTFALYEWTPGEPPPATFEEGLPRLYPPEDGARLQAAVQRAIEEGEPYELDLRVNLPSGTTAYHHAIGTPITDEHGRVVELHGTVQDITERKVTELALRRHRERLEVLHRADRAILAESTPQEIAEAVMPYLEQIKPEAQLTITNFDFQAGEMEVLAAHVGAGDSKIKPGAAIDLDHVWYLDDVRAGARYTVTDLSVFPADSPLAKILQEAGIRAFTIFPLIGEDTLLGALNVALPSAGTLSTEALDAFRAITNQLAIGLQQARLRRALRAYNEELQQRVEERTASLRATEARFRATFEGAAIGIAQLTEHGEILESNPALKRLLGYNSGDLARKNFTDLLHPDAVAKASEHYRALLAGKRDYYRQELRMTRADGQEIDANVTISALAATADHPQFAIAMVEDITERKLAQKELIRAEKLSITGKLAASLAHEINNPLQTVIGALGLTREVLEEGGSIDRYLDISMQELERAARIVSDLRNLNRPSKPEEQEPVKLNALLEDVLTLTEKRCQNRNVEVSWEPAPTDPVVSIVRDRMQQVFLNLVLNAVDAMPGGGQLEIAAQTTETPEGVKIQIIDTGVGIAPEDQQQLFEAFYTTKSDGVGLGLYITHAIVEDHGGEISVESVVGDGTTFTVWLPLATEDSDVLT